MTASCTTPSRTGDTSVALTKAAQAAWEAPELRPTFTPDGGRETWAHPCPDWCTGDGEGHQLDSALDDRREHQSHELRVRQDGAYGYWDEDGSTEGLQAAHIGVSLRANSRAINNPTIRMEVRYGKRHSDGEVREAQFRVARMFPDEVRELITVLQHLLKVAGA